VKRKPTRKLTKRQKDAINAASQHAKRRPVTLPPTTWDMGATGPANRDRLHQEPATEIDPATGKDQPNPNGVRRMRRRPWVETYARQGKLTKAQQTAAENLYAAYSGHPARDPLAVIGETVDRERYTDPQSATVDARRRFYVMWQRVPQSSRAVMEHVVLADRPVRAMACRYNSQSEERQIKRLRAGLDAIG
jgi:hypothetical protein